MGFVWRHKILTGWLGSFPAMFLMQAGLEALGGILMVVCLAWTVLGVFGWYFGRDVSTPYYGSVRINGTNYIPGSSEAQAAQARAAAGSPS
jgi:hypothetical protein